MSEEVEKKDETEKKDAAEMSAELNKKDAAEKKFLVRVLLRATETCLEKNHESERFGRLNGLTIFQIIETGEYGFIKGGTDLEEKVRKKNSLKPKELKIISKFCFNFYEENNYFMYLETRRRSLYLGLEVPDESEGAPLYSKVKSSLFDNDNDNFYSDMEDARVIFDFTKDGDSTDIILYYLPGIDEYSSMFSGRYEGTIFKPGEYEPLNSPEICALLNLCFKAYKDRDRSGMKKMEKRLASLGLNIPDFKNHKLDIETPSK